MHLTLQASWLNGHCHHLDNYVYLAISWKWGSSQIYLYLWTHQTKAQMVPDAQLYGEEIILSVNYVGVYFAIATYSNKLQAFKRYSTFIPSNTSWVSFFRELFCLQFNNGESLYATTLDDLRDCPVCQSVITFPYVFVHLFSLFFVAFDNVYILVVDKVTRRNAPTKVQNGSLRHSLPM